MTALNTFNFCTVVCNGCAERIDSNVDQEILRDTEDLLDWRLEESGWVRENPSDDEKWLCECCAKSEEHRRHPGEGRLICEKNPLFGVMCDRCGSLWEDSTNTGCEYFAELGYAEDEARGEGWQEIGGRMYCPNCWYHTEDVSDEEYAKTDGDYVKHDGSEVEVKGERLLAEQREKNAKVRKECHLAPDSSGN